MAGGLAWSRTPAQPFSARRTFSLIVHFFFSFSDFGGGAGRGGDSGGAGGRSPARRTIESGALLPEGGYI